MNTERNDTRDFLPQCEGCRSIYNAPFKPKCFVQWCLERPVFEERREAAIANRQARQQQTIVFNNQHTLF